MNRRKAHIALLSRGLTRELVFCQWGFNFDALVFLNMTEQEAKHEIAETAWQDRAEWVATRPFRAYPGWSKDQVIEMEELLKPADVDNIYVDC
jgi:hypothetical protein